MSASEARGANLLWLKLLVGVHWLAAVACVWWGYNGVDNFVDGLMVGIVVAAWGWLRWRHVAWVRKATVVLHGVLLIVLLVGTLAALPALFSGGWSGLGALVLLGIAWATIAPVSGFSLWALSRRDAEELFQERMPPLRFGLSTLLAMMTLAGVASLGFYRQVDRDGVVSLSEAFDIDVRIYSRDEMAERSVDKFIRAVKYDNKSGLWEAWHHIASASQPHKHIGSLLADADPAVRRSTIHMTQAYSSPLTDLSTVAILLERLHDPGPSVRLAVVESLQRQAKSKTSDDQVIDALKEATADDSEEVSLAAVRALVAARLDPRSFHPLLVQRLKDGHPSVRIAAADALGQAAFEEAEVLTALLEATAATDAAVRNNAAVAAVHVGSRDPKLTPLLIEGLKDQQLAPSAAMALAELGPSASEAVPALLQAVKSPQYQAHAAAFAALAAMGPQASQAVNELTRMVADRQAKPYQGRDAIRVLAEIGPPASSAQAEILKCAPPDGAPLCSNAPLALARIAPDSPKVLPALLKALEYRPSEFREKVDGENTRLSAVRGLEHLGGLAAPAQHALREATQDTSLAVRVCAAHTLWKINPDEPANVDAWQRALVELEGLIRLGRYDALWNSSQFGADAAPLLPAIQEQLSNKNSATRSQAVQALLDIAPQDETVRQAAESLLDDPSDSVRRAAAKGLARQRAATK